ncbi:uncharacterized protein [Triticum aestivum]|uniref:uncharacterized protein isoform X2 n=1 Tax=Triticum aestivum TaxID=4565 RepID=UPI001D034564|nr:uncharacterized protein LOC123053201 isoform X2 [Triticum aestivum]
MMNMGQKGRAIEQIGRQPCCDKVGLKKGPWTEEEDQKLVVFLLTLLILLCVWMCLCGFGYLQNCWTQHQCSSDPEPGSWMQHALSWTDQYLTLLRWLLL